MGHDRFYMGQDWVTLLFLALGLVVILLKFIDKERLNMLWKLPFDSYYFVRYENSAKQLYRYFYLALFGISIITFSLFTFFWIQHLKHTQQPFDFFLFLKIVGFTTSYFILKHLTGKLLAWIFNISHFHHEMIHIKSVYFSSIHLYLLPLLIPLVYRFNEGYIYLIIVSIIYLILLIVRYLFFFFKFKNDMLTHLFYFILYLCTLEIVPLLLISSWLLNSNVI
jgi:hypothetical protein